MFAAQATAMKYIGLFESPSPRKIEAMILYAVMNGIPMKQTVRYPTAPSTASAGVDITDTIGFLRISSRAVRTTEISMKTVTVLPMSSEAFLRSPRPIACPIETVEPIASPTSMTVSMCMHCEPTATLVVDATGSN